MTVPGVSVVIPTWNGRHLLAEFLPSVVAAAQHYQKTTGGDAEIIVVDDAGGKDDTVTWLPVHFPQVNLIARKENGGFARAANSGFAAAKYPIIFLLNNDIRVEPDAIEPLTKHFRNKDVFAVCAKAFRLDSDLFDGAGKIGNFNKGHWRNFLNYDILPTKLKTNTKASSNDSPQAFYSFVASGGYSAFDTEKLRILGGFCELLSPFYWEDNDLSYRAWKRGWQINYEPNSIVHHKSSATIGKKFPSRNVEIIAERNRLLMHWINLHDQAWLYSHFFWIAMKLLGSLFSFNTAYFTAVRDALRLWPQAKPLREREKRLIKRSDKEVAQLFNEIMQQPWAVVIRNPEDYYRYVAIKKELANS